MHSKKNQRTFDLKKTMSHKLLFVCFGNICRSPIAHYIAQKKWQHADCQSAGLYASTRDHATPEAVKVAKEYGVNLEPHRATRLSSLNLHEFDYIFCLEKDVYNHLKNQIPTEKLIDWHVDDPYSFPISTYRTCAQIIAQKIEEFEW